MLRRDNSFELHSKNANAGVDIMRFEKDGRCSVKKILERTGDPNEQLWRVAVVKNAYNYSNIAYDIEFEMAPIRLIY